MDKEKLETILKHNKIKYEFVNNKDYITVHSKDDSIFFATRYPSLIRMIEAFLDVELKMKEA